MVWVLLQSEKCKGLFYDSTLGAFIRLHTVCIHVHVCSCVHLYVWGGLGQEPRSRFKGLSQQHSSAIEWHPQTLVTAHSTQRFDLLFSPHHICFSLCSSNYAAKTKVKIEVNKSPHEVSKQADLIGLACWTQSHSSTFKSIVTPQEA